MCPVTLWSVAGMFALAKVGSFRFFSFKNDRREICVFMIAIAKRLILRMATRAIGIFLAGFQVHLFGKAGGNFGLVHETLLEKYPSDRFESPSLDSKHIKEWAPIQRRPSNRPHGIRKKPLVARDQLPEFG